MKITIRAKAADDLEAIYSWIAKDNPQAARRVIRRLRDRIERLGAPGLAYLGRPGIEPGTRELIEPPYIIIYTVDRGRDQITVLAVFHGAQDRPRRS
jgi:toxin ParE1/3/4